MARTRRRVHDLLSADRIEEQRISRQRLAAVLRAKAEENDAAFADAYFDQRRFAFDAIAAQQPTGKKRIFILWIPSDDLHA